MTADRQDLAVDVLIVGAGLAGLQCARILTERGMRCAVVDAADAVGGRIRTDRVEGFLLDRGFQVLLTAYPEASKALDYDALDLKPFRPGALVWDGKDFHRLSDPFRDPRGGLATLLSPVGHLADKARIGLLRRQVTSGTLDSLISKPETWTYTALRARGFSGDMIESFLRPFLAGVFLESDLETSSRFFEFVFRMFSLGDTSLPSQGMEAIPRQLAARLPEGSVRLASRVERVEEGRVTLAGGTVVEASSIVIATDANAAARLLGLAAPPPPNSTTCVYFSSPAPPVNEPILVLNGSGNGLINNVCIPDQVASTYAPDGRSLVSASVIGLPEVESGIEDAVQRELQAWFGPVAKRFEHLRTYRIPNALPDQSPGILEPVEKPARISPGIYVAGDHRDTASINGALASGRRAAEAILER